MIRTHRQANEFIAKKKAEFATQAPGFGDREWPHWPLVKKGRKKRTWASWKNFGWLGYKGDEILPIYTEIFYIKPW